MTLEQRNQYQLVFGNPLDPWFANAYGLVVDNDLGVDQKIKLAKEFIDRYSEQPRRRTGFETVLKTLTTSEQSCRVPYRG